ncbi:MAG: mechanosensitive ion channel [Muribaculaceae bacterium]|nr:mechanosensitive ion channel [Muribaculaceae bacterium]
MIDRKIYVIAHDLLDIAGIPAEYIPATTTIMLLTCAVLLGLGLYWLLSRPVANFLNGRIKKSSTVIDDLILTPHNVHAICALIVVVLFGSVVPELLAHYPKAIPTVGKITRIVNIVMITWVSSLLVRGLSEYLGSSGNKRGGSLVIRNLLNTIIGCVATLLIVSIILNRNLSYIISGLGAMAAVLMLVFKDSILGMMAGIRLTLNKMLKVNDWVSVPKYGAEGRVEDLTLTAVKIRNWDMSVSTVPPYALISDGFTNHESMLDKGIRQIRRTFTFDVNTVRRLSMEEMKSLSDLNWLQDIDLDTPQVNLKLFRRWLKQYIDQHPRTCPAPRLFVKEHPQTAEGLPLELHCFVKCVEWAEFEELQADILDEIIATVGRFSLRLYQLPSGADIRPLSDSRAEH